MMGGIGSNISGGKFEDSAFTASFGYLFNNLKHKQNDDSLVVSKKVASMDHALSISSAYDKGYEYGTEYAREKKQAEQTKQNRMTSNINNEVGQLDTERYRQEQAQRAKQISLTFALPVEGLAEKAIGTKNLIYTTPFSFGFAHGVYDRNRPKK